MTPNPFIRNNPNVTEIDLSSTYELFHKLFNYGELIELRNYEFGFVRKGAEIFERLMNECLDHPQVRELITESEKFHFDLMIIEYTGYVPLLAFAEIYDCPVVGITSFESPGFVYSMLGNENNPMIHPEQYFPFVHGELTFIQRWTSLKSTVMLIFALIIPPSPLQRLNNVLSNHFPNVNRGLFELIEQRVELLLTNTHPALGFIRPILPNTIQLGFMHIEPPKPLKDGELKSFLNNSEHGVIYMSFGSNIRSRDLESDLIEIFSEVFRSIKYDVVWKFENHTLPYISGNLLKQTWLPQADILAHPNVKLFITQGGQQSVEEAIDRTVPMIIIPMMSDQPGMAVKLEQKGVGRVIDFDNVTKDALIEAINEVIKPIYKKNVEKLRALVYDQPMTSREKAVWWVEHVLRHKGAKHLEYPGRLVPFYQKYCLDFIGIGLIVIYSSHKLMKFILRTILRVNKIKIE